MTTVQDLSAPAPLRLPAILQNPANSALRQVEAHNAQQRERLAAKKDREREREREGRAGGKNAGRGKRVIRRLDNATFASNPHIVNPMRSDYSPSVPLHPRPARPSFPTGAISRSAPIPPAVVPTSDPRSSDSVNGAFSMSLKGTRAMLRKRGRRVEQLVQRVESNIRQWLEGEYDLSSAHSGSWRIIDETLLDLYGPTEATSPNANSSTSTSTGEGLNPESVAGPSAPSPLDRRMPAQHQITALLPPLPTTTSQGAAGQINAVLEYSRSPAHLSWYIHDGFERLVVHLVCRYYELLSWSEEHRTTAGQPLRLTQIVVPSIARPSAQPDSYHLLTPETSELSSQSGPESSVFTSDSEDARGPDSESESESDAATERGDEADSDSVLGDTTLTSLPDVGGLSLASAEHLGAQGQGQEANLNLDLERTISNTSSAYASSEGGSEYSSGLGDSYVLPARPPGGGLGRGPLGGIPPPSGWSDIGSEVGFPAALPVLPLPIRADSSGMGQGARAGRRWEDKPTFFEYLYGA